MTFRAMTFRTSRPMTFRAMGRKAQLWLLSLAAFLLGCESPPARGESGPRPPAPVVVALATDEAMLVERRYLGEVWAAADAALSVAEPGRVKRILAVEGSRVEKGQLLIELEDSLARAQLGEAVAQQQRSEVDRDQASLDADRYELLERESAVSELEAERQRSQAKSLEAEKASLDALVQARREQVSRHRLLAPFDGTITSRLVDPGHWLTPGQTALRLLTEGRLEVLVRVPPSLLDRIEDLTEVSLESEERTVPATLQSTVGALDRDTRTGLLRVLPEEVPAWLRAGASVDVVFRLRRQEGLNLPADAVVTGAVGSRVFAVSGQEGQLTVRAVPVVVLETGGPRVLLRAEDLKAGDRVVVKGNERLRPGQPVTTEGVTAASEPTPDAAAPPKRDVTSEGRPSGSETTP